MAVYNNYADPAGLTYTFISAGSPDHPGLISGPFTVTSYGGYGSVTIPDDGTTYRVTVNGVYAWYKTASPDTTAPVVTLQPARPPDHGTFYTTPVDFLMTAFEPFSGDSWTGLAKCDPSIYYSGPYGLSIRVIAHCIDFANNQGIGSAIFDYDATAPTKYRVRRRHHQWSHISIRLCPAGSNMHGYRRDILGCLVHRVRIQH